MNGEYSLEIIGVKKPSLNYSGMDQLSECLVVMRKLLDVYDFVFDGLGEIEGSYKDYTEGVIYIIKELESMVDEFCSCEDDDKYHLFDGWIELGRELENMLDESIVLRHDLVIVDSFGEVKSEYDIYNKIDEKLNKSRDAIRKVGYGLYDILIGSV